MANFNDQWIEVFSAGKRVDDQGVTRNLTVDFLEQVVRNYDAKIHEAPAVIGHPLSNAPAFGWANKLRVNNGILEVQFKEVDPDFEAAVRNGHYKKRSASFYLDKSSVGSAPYLRHIGFLGAAPPAVKGLKAIQFTEGDALTFEFCEGDSSMPELEEKQVNSIVDRIMERVRAAFGGGKGDQPANFSEAAVSKMVADVVTEATTKLTASFTEELKKSNDLILALQKTVNSQGATTTRQSIISFCEGLGPAAFPPAFKRMGVIEFMEQLATVDQKVNVISFTEQGGKEVEEKKEVSLLNFFETFLTNLGPFIQFSEMLGGLSASDAADEQVSKERTDKLLELAGATKKEGGSK